MEKREVVLTCRQLALSLVGYFSIEILRSCTGGVDSAELPRLQRREQWDRFARQVDHLFNISQQVNR